MPRVLLVLHEDTLGGATRSLLRAVDVLLGGGWEVSAWCNRPSPLYDELLARGYDVAGAPRLMRYRPRSLRHPPGVRARLRSLPAAQLALRAHLRATRPDLVHVNGRLALPEAVTARLSGLPVVTHIHDDALPGLRGLVTRVVPWTVSREVLAVGRAHARSLELGRRAPRVVVGSTPLRPAPATERRAGGPVVVGLLGALLPRKGTDLFVGAAERLRDAGTPLELRLAGPLDEGPFRAWGEEQIARGAAAGVAYLGVVDPAAELPGWDIMVVPSRNEPFGLVVSEAMAHGVAVVGADLDGITEQLEGGVGVLVPPEDVGALATAIGELAADPERRVQLAAAGRRRVEERYTPERSAAQLEAAWRAALDHRIGTR